MSDSDEYQPRIPEDKYKVQFTVDPDVMLTQPHRLRDRTERWVSMEERTEGTNCALYQMGICSERDALHKSLMSGKDGIRTFYSLTKAANFDFRDVGSRFRFEKGELKDNSQMAELMILRAATESRHCIWKIISHAVEKGRHLSPAELQLALDSTRLASMPKGWEEFGSRAGDADPPGSRDGQHARGEKHARTVGADPGDGDNNDSADGDRTKRRCGASRDTDQQHRRNGDINPSREGRGRSEIMVTARDQHRPTALSLNQSGSRQLDTASTVSHIRTEAKSTKQQGDQSIIKLSREDSRNSARAGSGKRRHSTDENQMGEAGIETSRKPHQHGSTANTPRNNSGSSSPYHRPAGRQGQQAVVIDLTGDDSDDGGHAR